MRVDICRVRTASYSATWRASCVIAGETIAATARDCATRALARRLVDRGIPDEPMEIYGGTMNRGLTCIARSFHALAAITSSQALAAYLTLPPERGRRSAA